MQNFSMLIQGFGTALTPMNIGVCMLGAVLGLIVGAMPGIGSLAGVALLLPHFQKMPLLPHLYRQYRKQFRDRR